MLRKMNSLSGQHEFKFQLDLCYFGVVEISQRLVMEILRFANNVVKIWKLLVFWLPLFRSWFDFTRLLKSKLRHAKETIKNTVLKNVSQTSWLCNKIVEKTLIFASNWHSPYVSIYFTFTLRKALTEKMKNLAPVKIMKKVR